MSNRCWTRHAGHHARGGRPLPPFMLTPSYRALHHLDGKDSSVPSSSSAATNYATLVSTASSLSKAGAIAARGPTTKLSKALSMPAEDIDTSKPLHTYGADSLLAVEMRNWVAREIDSGGRQIVMRPYLISWEGRVSMLLGWPLRGRVNLRERIGRDKSTSLGAGGFSMSEMCLMGRTFFWVMRGLVF
jgi:hypothetical protein